MICSITTLLLLASTCAASVTHLPSVTLASGVLIGTTTSLPAATATVNKYLGVPFAASPVRFSPPTKPTPWAKPLNVSAWKPACIQQFNYPEAARNFSMLLFNGVPAPQESEDCLYANIYVPSTTPPKGGFPVMFWIYGGSYKIGNAGQVIYDGSSFASYQDVIVVSANYRINVFGFPGAPELPYTERNLGQLDQHFALEWVQKNIHKFKGNPDKVTIFGESAGAVAVDALVTSYTKNAPFRAAILQSGQTSPRGLLYLGANATSSWYKLAAALNCSTTHPTSNLTCIRAANATTLKSILEHNALYFSSQTDGVTLVANSAAARVARNIANVSILTGTNAQEGNVFVYGQNNLSAFLTTTFPGATAFQNSLKAAYPPGSPGLPTEFSSISAIYTDLVFTCPQSLMANQSATAGYPTWRYYYNASFPNTQILPGLGVYHSSEIAVIFGTYPTVNATAQQYALSQTLQTAWATFAKNPTRGPGWNPLGTFGGVDLATLGSNGNSGVSMVSQNAVDSKCPVFAPFYATLCTSGGQPGC